MQENVRIMHENACKMQGNARKILEMPEKHTKKCQKICQKMLEKSRKNA